MKSASRDHRCSYTIRLLPAVIAFAMTIPASAQQLEEIVVTAQKREQSLQDVGISITAIGGEALREGGVISTEMLEEQVPGLMMVNTASSSVNTLPSIRGVSQNDYSTHQEMPNAVYIDGVYISNPAAIGFGMFDLERVEVLRGPQGTLFGRNATGGLLQFVTMKPSEMPEAYIDGSVSDTDGNPGWRTEAMLNGPLGDSLRGRLSGFYEDAEGYWENTAPEGDNAYQIDGQWGLRGQLQLDASEDLTMRLSYQAGGLKKPSRQGMYLTVPAYVDPTTGFGVEITPETDPGDIFGYGGDPGAVNGACPGCDYFGQLPQEPYKGSFNSAHIFMDKESYSTTADVTWNLDSFTLTSITNFQDFSFDYNEDCDGSPIDYCQFPFGTAQEQWSQELRLNGLAGSVIWQTGLYYVDIAQKNKVGFDGAEGFTYSIFNRFTQDMDSWAAFGQVEYPLNDQWKVIGGLRWTEEQKSIDSQAWNSPAEFFPDSSVQDLPQFLVYDYQDSRSANDWSGVVTIDYTPTDDLLLYATISRGTKGGGYNGNGGGLDNASLDPEVYFRGEVLVNYEVGFKATLWEDRLRLNGSSFYYDYSDYQSFEVRNSLASFVANKDATFYGGELELLVLPAEGWTLNLGLSVLDTEVRDITLPNGDIVDRESAVAPPVSVNGSLRKEWLMDGGSAVTALVDFNYVDEYYASTFNQAATTIPDYTVGNARLSYTSSDDRWDVALFVKNLTDETNQSYGFDFAVLGVNLKMYNPPRTTGVQFRYRWL